MKTGNTDIAEIEGRRLRLRLVNFSDAAYIYELRTDPTYNSHLSEISGSIEDQRVWIEHYKEREAAGEEYYYVIERGDGLPCGLVRLYDIGDDSFTWGSWILDRNKPAKAALESAVLSFGVGFEVLGLQCASLDVRRRNATAIAFYRRFGMTETRSDIQNLYFKISRDEYLMNRPAYMDVINASAAV